MEEYCRIKDFDSIKAARMFHSMTIAVVYRGTQRTKTSKKGGNQCYVTSASELLESARAVQA